MQTYESIFIAPADADPARLDAFIDKIKDIITKPGGEGVSVEKWGRRRLAYPIRRHREGFYTLITFKAPESVPAELTRFYGVSEEVIRQLTCKAPRPNPVREKPAVPVAPKEEANAQPSAPAPAQ